MSLPRYAKYNDSGVEWLGQVPEHWDVVPLRYRSRLITVKTDARTNQVALENIEGWTGKWLDSDAEYEGDGVAFVRGDVLFGKLRPYLAKVYLADRSGEAVGDFHVVRPDGALGGRFLQYWMLNRLFIEAVNGSTFGSKMPRADWGFIGSTRVSVPPLVEQTAIAEFLDRETAKIDALVAEQKQLVGLMKEKRQALLSHAVTKGLNPNVPMKDSGIECLGEIPAHWNVRNLASLTTKITNGYVGPTRDVLTDSGVRYLQSLHIKNGKIRFDNPYYVSQEWSEAHAKSVLETGDVLVVQTGDIGQVAAVPEEFAGCNCHALIIASPARSVVTGEWLAAVLNGEYGRQLLLSIQTGALHPHLNCGNVKLLPLPLPPLEEQCLILGTLDPRMREVDDLTAEAQRAIELLHERRAALISAAVTGQIDVREAAERAA